MADYYSLLAQAVANLPKRSPPAGAQGGLRPRAQALLTSCAR